MIPRPSSSGSLFYNPGVTPGPSIEVFVPLLDIHLLNVHHLLFKIG